MNDIVSPPALRRSGKWRRQIGCRSRRGRRPYGALGWLTDTPPIGGLVDVERLTLVLLHEERQQGNCRVLRLAGFSGQRIPWGVKFGGPEGSRFEKDLGLPPKAGARGRRIDLANHQLLRLGLALDRLSRRQRRHRRMPEGTQLTLPKLWAGFRPEVSAGMTGDGPELIGACHMTGQSRGALMAQARRIHQGLVLYPLEWVSHHWQTIFAIFADLADYPRRQAFEIRDPADDLIGFRGACGFDLCNTRFRSIGTGRP